MCTPRIHNFIMHTSGKQSRISLYLKHHKNSLAETYLNYVINYY